MDFLWLPGTWHFYRCLVTLIGEHISYPTHLREKIIGTLAMGVWFVFLSFTFTISLTLSHWFITTTNSAEFLFTPGVYFPFDHWTPPPEFSRSISNKVLQNSTSSFSPNMSFFLVTGSFIFLLSESRCYYYLIHITWYSFCWFIHEHY